MNSSGVTWNATIFLVGAVGALAPEAVRLYKMRSRPEKVAVGAFYLLVSLLFMALGGMVALVFPARTLFQAFYLGVSLPMVISALAGRLPRRSAGTAPIVDEPQSLACRPGIRGYLGLLFD